MYVCGTIGFASCGLQTFFKNRNLVWIFFFLLFIGIMKIQNKKYEQTNSMVAGQWLEREGRSSCSTKKTNQSPTPDRARCQDRGRQSDNLASIDQCTQHLDAVQYWYIQVTLLVRGGHGGHTASSCWAWWSHWYIPVTLLVRGGHVGHTAGSCWALWSRRWFMVVMVVTLVHSGHAGGSWWSWRPH